MGTPAVSIIMSAYNAEAYIGAAIQSIENQTFKDFELIIINDGSTDGTSAVAGGFADRDSRVKIFTKENSGAADSRNFGFGKSGGDFISIMDADDIAEPKKLELQLKEFAARPALGLLGSCWIEIDGNGTELSKEKADTGDRTLRKVLLRRCPFCHGSVMMRAATLHDAGGGYRPAFKTSEDYDLYLRIPEKWELDNLGEYLYRHRTYSANLTMSTVDKRRSMHEMFAVYTAFQRRFTGTDDIDSGRDEWMKNIIGACESGTGIGEPDRARLRRAYGFMAKSFLLAGDAARARRFTKFYISGKGIH